jgi:SagB-type dehydrogenase family enzyme
MDPSYEGITKYHERTKHHPFRYARSAGYLDWEGEPDPFRRYEGAPLVKLPLLRHDPDGSYAAMFGRNGIPAMPFSLRAVAAFLELSMGLSAWKSHQGNSWSLRMNPSSGNLHPVEAYVILPSLTDNGLPGGVIHYTPLLHALERRAAFDEAFWPRIKGHFRSEGFLAALSSIHWRESWKYGERAFRYSHLDLGHAVAAMSFAAALLGWKVTYLNALADRDVETIMGFTRTAWKKYEQEEPGPLLFIHSADEKNIPRGLPEEIVRSFDSITFQGEPNLLSRRHRDWSVIDDVSSLTVKPATPEETYRYGDHISFIENGLQIKAADVIRKRRSAQAYDGLTAISKKTFFSILDGTMPRSCCPPFDAELVGTSVHLLLFIHRVDGLEPGLYFLSRDGEGLEKLKGKCRPGFLWERVAEAPKTLPLYLLERGDFQREAVSASCDQDIAGDGAFAAAMISRFDEPVKQRPYQYRHLHWEAGMIGQVLYLGAEAHGMRGTGMGCFFDDVVHEIMGLPDTAYQDVYHFSVGKAVEDPRLVTLPPYEHLKKE